MADKGDKVTLSKPVIGFIVAGLVAAFGGGVAASSRVFGEAQAREAKNIPLVLSSMVPLPPGTISLDKRLESIETTLNAQSLTLNSVVTELADVKSRLPKHP